MPSARISTSIWQTVHAYDAMYVALAEGLRAPLLTLNVKLAKLAKLAKTTGHVAKIEVL